jgi:hypothetical protein
MQVSTALPAETHVGLFDSRGSCPPSYVCLQERAEFFGFVRHAASSVRNLIEIQIHDRVNQLAHRNLAIAASGRLPSNRNE